MLWTMKDLQASIDHPLLDAQYNPAKPYTQVEIKEPFSIEISWTPEAQTRNRTSFWFQEVNIPVQILSFHDHPTPIFAHLDVEEVDGKKINPIFKLSYSLVDRWPNDRRGMIEAAIASAVIRALGPRMTPLPRLSIDQLAGGEFDGVEYLYDHLTRVFVSPATYTEYLLQLLLQGSPYQQIELLNRIKALMEDSERPTLVFNSEMCYADPDVYPDIASQHKDQADNFQELIAHLRETLKPFISYGGNQHDHS